MNMRVNLKSMRYKIIPSLILPALLLAACGGNAPATSRIELPQAYRLQSNQFSTMLEKRTGRIAITLEDGNVVVMDQTGGNIVPITRDAQAGKAAAGNAMSTNTTSAQSDVLTVYNMPVWSPDGQNLALVEITSKRPVMSSTIELSPESVTIQRGPGSAVVERTEQGQQVQPVAPGSVVERRPDMVIIQRGRNTGDLVSTALYVAQADGKRPLKELYLSNNEDIPYIDWSPDGSKISFLTHNVQDEQYAFNLVDSSGASKPNALLTGSSLFWHWHPDGEFLLTKAGLAQGNTSSGSDQLALLDPKTNATTPIGSAAEPMPFLAPSFSPDGQFIAMTKRDGNSFKLILADNQGKEIKTLTQFNGTISFAWANTGSQLAYVVRQSSQIPGGALRVVNATTGEDKTLTQLPVMAFFWSPDGTHIATYTSATMNDIDPNFAGYNFAPPGAREVMLLQTIDVKTKNTRQLFYLEPTQAFRRLISEFDRYSRAVTIWSPDSRKLVFTLSYGSDTDSQDYVVESESSGSLVPRILTNGALAFWSPK